jgi:CubicO group peptidase (beta-lactamase class C family)
MNVINKFAFNAEAALYQAGRPPEFIAYHDVSGDEHQRQFNDLYPRGFRIISLSVYGDRANSRYAVVWVRRSGPRWSAVHGVDFAGFQNAFNEWAGRGFKPKIIAASGQPDNPVFAAVFEETTGSIPFTRHGLTHGSVSDTGTIEHWLAEARTQNWLPTTLAIYGTTDDRRYAIVLEPNEDQIAWGIGHLDQTGPDPTGPDQTGSDYQATFDALVPAWNRPAYVAVSPAGRYLSLFRDDQIGPWIARHDMTSDGYQAEFNRWVAAGFYPINVQAGGSGAGTRFAAIFVQSETSLPRSFTLTGPNTSALVDDVIMTFMRRHVVRQAALAIVQDRRLVYAKGFTFAEPGHPVTQPTTHFRVASCSKVLTSIVIHQLIQEGRLGLTDKVQDILQLRTPSGAPPQDPRFADITIENLLAMRGWLQRVEEEDVATAFNQPLPVSDLQIARVLATEQLRNPPGAPGEGFDGNPDFLLLGLVAETLYGIPMLDIVRQRIGIPLGAPRIRLGVAPLNRQPDDEARYYDVLLQTTQSDVEPLRPLIPFQYGEFDYKAWAAAGGFSVAAVDFAKVLAALNTSILLNDGTRRSMLVNAYGWDFSLETSGGAIHTVKGGYLEGLQSTVNFTQGGLAYVLFWNRSSLPNDAGWYPEFPLLLDAIDRTSWPTDDLFSTFGIPSLP